MLGRALILSRISFVAAAAAFAESDIARASSSIMSASLASSMRTAFRGGTGRSCRTSSQRCSKPRGRAAMGAHSKRPVVRWHGGKWRLAAWVISFFPRHVTYVEPFGGGPPGILPKAPAKAELYHDLRRRSDERRGG